MTDIASFIFSGNRNSLTKRCAKCHGNKRILGFFFNLLSKLLNLNVNNKINEHFLPFFLEAKTVRMIVL